MESEIKLLYIMMIIISRTAFLVKKFKCFLILIKV